MFLTSLSNGLGATWGHGAGADIGKQGLVTLLTGALGGEG
jgi:hypothetical protein